MSGWCAGAEGVIVNGELPVVVGVAFCLGFFFNDTATTEIYTLSLHDALPILEVPSVFGAVPSIRAYIPSSETKPGVTRSEEHTSELQSRQYLVRRLSLAKKNTSRF